MMICLIGGTAVPPEVGCTDGKRTEICTGGRPVPPASQYATCSRRITCTALVYLHPGCLLTLFESGRCDSTGNIGDSRIGGASEALWKSFELVKIAMAKLDYI